MRDICWMLACMLCEFMLPPRPICLLICCMSPLLPLPGPMMSARSRLYSPAAHQGLLSFLRMCMQVP